VRKEKGRRLEKPRVSIVVSKNERNRERLFE
jgi:hypothetical protein